METREELQSTRQELVDRLARETYLISAYNDERLAKIVGIKAGIEAIDYILENDIKRPPPGDPQAFFA